MDIYESRNIRYCPDGKYRWVYELNMYRNPSILFLLWKIFAGIMLEMWLLLVLLSLGDPGFFFQGLFSMTRGYLLFFLFFMGLVTISYYIYAVFLGGRYCVLFEMNEEGIVHIQKEKQFRKAELVAALTVFAGLASGKPGVVGSGILAGGRSSISSSFRNVKSIQAFRKRNLIKVNAPFSKNQIYAEAEDFDFVLSYLCTHCGREAEWK